MNPGNKKGLVLVLVLMGMVFISACKELKQQNSHLKESKPNIILVFVDDLGYGDLGCYGQKVIQTPNIDRMAAEGIRFTDFYSASPVCAPSRCSLMTGKHAGNSYIRHNINVLPLGQMPIPSEEITIAELLKEKGYATAAMGKWSLGAPGNSGDPLEQGFDHFFGYYCQCYAHNYYPESLWRNKEKVPLRNEIIPVKVNFIKYPLSYASKKVDYSGDLIFDEAVEFIQENKDRPFFLYYATQLPHGNGEAPADERFEVPNWGIYKDKDWKPTEKGYASMVTKLDTQMGIIMQKLEELSIAENTLVIFTSDNGPANFSKRFESAGLLRGRKRDLYEGGTRVPFIAWQPGMIPAGDVTDHPAAMYDLLATFCDATDIDSPAKTDGRSILPTLTGKNQPTPDNLYWEFYEGVRKPKQAVRSGDWKLIRFHFNDPEKREVELYNLKDDIAEKHNIADQHPDIVKRLTRIIDAEHSAYPHRNVQPK